MQWAEQLTSRERPCPCATEALYTLVEGHTMPDSIALCTRRRWAHPGAAAGLAGAQSGLLVSELGAGPEVGDHAPTEAPGDGR